MRRRDFLMASSSALAGLLLPRGVLGEEPLPASPLPPSPEPPAEPPEPPERPNIVFILGDDVGLGVIGCYGSDRYDTPHIDALAAEGIRFERCYSTPLCGPSRCQILTGRYPFRTGLVSNHVPKAIDPSREVMMPRVLEGAGYVTGHVGKWGQMSLLPQDWGFREQLYYPGSGGFWSDHMPRYRVNDQERRLRSRQYLPDLMHDHAMDFITRHREVPFYLHYSLSHLHAPFVRTPTSKKKGSLYAENVSYMDELVGKLVDGIDSLGLGSKTLIVFAGDNGTPPQFAAKATINGQRLVGAKGSLHEGGCRVPLIARWPSKSPAGTGCADLVDISDFYPTFAELAGASLPSNTVIDGHSFAARLRDRSASPREWVYSELCGASFACDRRWKLASASTTDTRELFDLRNAPFEEILIPFNSDDPEAVAARARLGTVLDEHPAAPCEDKGQRIRRARRLR